MGKVTGLGGIFFKAKDPAMLKKWYLQHLGVGDVFLWKETDSQQHAYTVFNIFSENAPLFSGTHQSFILNYRVKGLAKMMGKLRKGGLTVEEMKDTDDGTFGSCIDPEGNKVILWEPLNQWPHVSHPSTDWVTGIGGIFFKSKNPDELKSWYQKELGMESKDGHFLFYRDDVTGAHSIEPACLEWSLVKSDSDYFAPGNQEFMVNFRVRSLVELLENLKCQRITAVGEVETFSYGKFGWILDGEGNKIELWEPVEGFNF